MADEVNTDAFEGGDTEAATKAAIEARNTALQAEVDAINTAFGDLTTANATYLDALATAEETAYTADPGLQTGDAINQQEVPEPPG